MMINVSVNGANVNVDLEKIFERVNNSTHENSKLLLKETGKASHYGTFRDRADDAGLTAKYIQTTKAFIAAMKQESTNYGLSAETIDDLANTFFKDERGNEKPLSVRDVKSFKTRVDMERKALTDHAIQAAEDFNEYYASGVRYFNTIFRDPLPEETEAEFLGKIPMFVETEIKERILTKEADGVKTIDKMAMLKEVMTNAFDKLSAKDPDGIDKVVKNVKVKAILSDFYAAVCIKSNGTGADFCKAFLNFEKAINKAFDEGVYERETPEPEKLTKEESAKLVMDSLDLISGIKTAECLREIRKTVKEKMDKKRSESEEFKKQQAELEAYKESKRKQEAAEYDRCMKLAIKLRMPGEEFNVKYKAYKNGEGYADIFDAKSEDDKAGEDCAAKQNEPKENGMKFNPLIEAEKAKERAKAAEREEAKRKELEIKEAERKESVRKANEMCDYAATRFDQKYAAALVTACGGKSSFDFVSEKIKKIGIDCLKKGDFADEFANFLGNQANVFYGKLRNAVFGGEAKDDLENMERMNSEEVLKVFAQDVVEQFKTLVNNVSNCKTLEEIAKVFAEAGVKYEALNDKIYVNEMLNARDEMLKTTKDPAKNLNAQLFIQDLVGHPQWSQFAADEKDPIWKNLNDFAARVLKTDEQLSAYAAESEERKAILENAIFMQCVNKVKNLLVERECESVVMLQAKLSGMWTDVSDAVKAELKVQA